MKNRRKAIRVPSGNRRCLCAILVGLFALLSVTSALSQEPKIFAYTQVRNAANIAIDEEGRAYPVDIGSRLFHAMMVETGLEYEIEIAPWARIIQYLDTRPNIAAYTLVRTAEREDRYHWIGLVININSYLYGLSERASELPSSIEEARSSRVGSIRNDAYDNLLLGLGFSNVINIANSAPWVELLERGRLDLVPFSEQALAEYLEQQGLSADALVPMIKLDALSTGLYIAVSKQTDSVLVDRMRAAYQAIVENGVYEEVLGAVQGGFPN